MKIAPYQLPLSDISTPLPPILLLRPPNSFTFFITIITNFYQLLSLPLARLE